jgi:Zn-dependent M28 family amino/carboxypeptidase
MRYGDATTKIPASTVTIEDADLLARLAAEGKPLRVRLSLATTELPDSDSANVVGELRGREKPDEIVLIGAHIDSWDVGPGAQDDGAGVAIVMQALTTLRSLNLVPRRTIRAVLFTNEENGLRGALAYAEAHREELGRHVAAFESDIGAGAPIGFMTDGPQPYEGELRDLATLLAPIGSNAVMAGYPGEDVKKLEPGHVPLFGLFLDPSHYFDVHHSAADTLDKIDPALLQKSVATLATMAFVIADRPGSFRSPPEAVVKVGP